MRIRIVGRNGNEIGQDRLLHRSVLVEHFGWLNDGKFDGVQILDQFWSFPVQKMMPGGTVFASDPGHSALRRLTDAGIPLGSGGFPHLFALDREGKIRYVQSGYKPGSGKEALQVLSDL
ncbi:hypothetical protein M0651_00500 [Paenibacillus sp. MBLB2552]|uniref:Uncharacterized protein n=1 Tax=Paenibacillus mellifer TaxID=2937794 RepID=A0A9X1XTG5_9BACL|nr:hypothetical protein [Paenibacillus mellifer]MCK8485650.1 hypothetical protein [Paenibacillus mellifer]